MNNHNCADGHAEGEDLCPANEATGPAGLHHYLPVDHDGRNRSCTRYVLRFTILLNVALSIGVAVLTNMVYRLSQPATSMTDSSASYRRLNWRPLPASETKISRIAFGSCSSQQMPQPYWDVLVTYDPDLVLLMGDNVYGDCKKLENPNTTDPGKIKEACAPLLEAYREMANHPSVQGAAPLLSVFPTLDDHDYGISDATVLNPYKEFAKDLFADFFQLNDLPTEGVYRSRVWGPTGERLQVILLDARYFKSKFDPTGNQSAPYVPTSDSSKQMLSEEEWLWLEEQLRIPADLRLIVSSLQVLNPLTPWEAWRHIPNEQTRLIEMAQNANALILSGDRHVGGFYMGDDGALLEVTASSWTHTMPLGAYSNCSSAAECDEIDPTRDGDLIRVNHFGGIEVDWSSRIATITLRKAQDSYGVPYKQHFKKKRGDAGAVIQHERQFRF